MEIPSLSPTGTRIRRFELADLPRVAEIRNASVAISRDFYSMTVDRVRPPSEAGAHPVTSEILVAEVDGRVEGYVHLYTDPGLLTHGRINIDAFHVRPECQRTGLGSQLLQAAVEKAREWHGRYLSIAIPDGIASSREFLLKHGFNVVRTFFKLRHPELALLPAPELPEGYRFRAFRQGIDEAEFLRLLNTSFAEHWDFAPVTAEELERWKQRPDFNPKGCFFIQGPDGSDVAVATVLIDRPSEAPDAGATPARLFEFGVLPAHRSRGLGRAILQKAAEFARHEELGERELVVDGEDGPARAMSERAGFLEKRSILVLHRPL